MLSRILLSCLTLTCSALRIQQKEKTSSGSTGCPYTECDGTSFNSLGKGIAQMWTEANPTTTADGCLKCRCFLAGYSDVGNGLGACGLKQQATVASATASHLTACWGDYWEPPVAAGANYETTGGTLVRGRWSTFLQCLVNNVPVSSRAVINPTGVNPFWLDPEIYGAQVQQIGNEILVKKADRPGSVPWEDCPGGLSSTPTWIRVCSGGNTYTIAQRASQSPGTTEKRVTDMFDGAGMCCGSTGVAVASAAGGDADDCTTKAAADTQCDGWGAVMWRPANLQYICRCDVKIEKCAVDSNTYGATNGGRNHDIYKRLHLCAS